MRSTNHLVVGSIILASALSLWIFQRGDDPLPDLRESNTARPSDVEVTMKPSAVTGADAFSSPNPDNDLDTLGAIPPSNPSDPSSISRTLTSSEFASNPPNSVERELFVIQGLIEAGEFEDGLIALSKLYDGAKSLSASDKAIVLDLYANLLLAMEMHQEAIAMFEELLAVEDIGTSQRLDASKALGELYLAEENYDVALEFYRDWMSESDGNNSEALLGFSLALYHLEEYEEAIPYMVKHVDLLKDLPEELDEGKLLFLNALAIRTENWDNALWVTEMLIDKFDKVRDWQTLAAVHVENGNTEALASVLLEAEDKGIFDGDLRIWASSD